MKKILVAAGAIVALMAGAMVAVYFQSAPEPTALPEGTVVVPPVAEPASERPPQAQAETSRLPAVGAPPKPMVYAPLPPPPPKGSWEAVKPVARVTGLGPAGISLRQGLDSLQGELAACFDEVAQSRHGQAGYTAAQEDTGAVDQAGSAVLMLQVESLEGKLRIVDAPVESRGDASDGLLSCAQSVLRGRTFPAPRARPGERHRVTFVLSP